MSYVDQLIPTVSVEPGTRGPWTVEQFEIPDEPSIGMLRLMMDGRGCRPGMFTKLVHAERGVVMSDTDAERRDHSEFVRRAGGHCLINGLGLGMCLNAVLRRPEVELVTVVEVDQDVVDLVWPCYAEHSDRCEVVVASAFDYQPPKGVRYGAVWHDIWDSICEDNRDEMSRLHRKYGRRADWQGSWGRDTLDRLRRQDRRWGW